MSGYIIAWAAWLAALITIEGLALASKRSVDTLSAVTRTAFATHTRIGRAAFGVAWVGFSVWYLGHILQWF